MATVPAEAAGFAGVAAFGPFMWAAYLFLMAALGLVAGVLVSLLLLEPRMVRARARER